jgi:hypothetical protein
MSNDGEPEKQLQNDRYVPEDVDVGAPEYVASSFEDVRAMPTIAPTIVATTSPVNPRKRVLRIPMMKNHQYGSFAVTGSNEKLTSQPVDFSRNPKPEVMP